MMHTIKLIQFLKKLSREELKSFVKFLQSPYHNSNKAALRLIDFLSGFYPGFDSKKLRKERVFKKVFSPEETYREDRLNQLFTQTVRLLEDFWAQESLRNDHYLQMKLYRNAYRERELHREFFNICKKMETEIEQRPTRGGQYYRDRYEWNEAILFHPQTNHNQPGLTRFTTCMQSMERLFVWEKLRWASMAMNRMQIASEEHEVPLVDEMIEAYQNLISEEKVLQFYQEILSVLRHKSGEEIIQAIRRFPEVSSLFSFEENRMFLFLLLNLSSQKIRNGATEFQALSFALYQSGLKNNLLVNETGRLMPITFTNIVGTAIFAGKFDWVEMFIENYQQLLPDEDRTDAVLLSKAFYWYYKGKKYRDLKMSERALDALLPINQRDPFYLYRVRSLILRIHYELEVKRDGSFQFVLDYIKAFEKNFRRNKSLNQKTKQAFFNFMSFIRKLIKLQLAADDIRTDVAALIEKTRTTPLLFGRDWLLEKAGELRIPRSQKI